MTIERENCTPPEWMVALENKKKHKLAHEIGAGAPCFSCKDDCLGLDLHFWRKICRNCKCKKEAHDVKEENNVEQFEILFGADLKCGDRVKNISLNLKCKLDDIFSIKEIPAPEKSDDDLNFDWVPPDVPPSLASEYLQQLPLEKLPITGSAGAVFRRQQLQKQMPLYDFKTNNCHDLTDEEVKAFSDYVDNLKSNAVGMGQITKVLPNSTESYDVTVTKPSLLSFSNNLNSIPKPFKSFVASQPESTEDILSQSTTCKPDYPTCELKTPSAFVQYKKFSGKSGARNINELNMNESFDNGNQTNPITVKDLTYDCQNKLNIHENLDSRNNNLPAFEENSLTLGENLTPSQIIRKFNSQVVPDQGAKNDPIKSSNRWNINSKPHTKPSNTLLPVRDIDVAADMTPSKNADVRFLKLGTPEQFVALSSYVPNSPQHSNALITVREKDTNDNTKEPFNKADSYTQNEVMIQNYRASPRNTNVVDPYDSQIASEINCRQCKEIIYANQVVVVAERAGVEVMWHPQCFVCIICEELLVDLIYFFHRGGVYCGRHYAEVLKIPRCYACDELIFTKEYTIAEGQTFHVKHFCCFECDIPLAGKRYVPKDDNPICLPCFESKYGQQCVYCEKIIQVDDSRVGWKELSWHATASCFKCIQCSKSLLNSKFIVRDDSPLCSKECLEKFKS